MVGVNVVPSHSMCGTSVPWDMGRVMVFIEKANALSADSTDLSAFLLSDACSFFSSSSRILFSSFTLLSSLARLRRFSRARLRCFRRLADLEDFICSWSVSNCDENPQVMVQRFLQWQKRTRQMLRQGYLAMIGCRCSQPQQRLLGIHVFHTHSLNVLFYDSSCSPFLAPGNELCPWFCQVHVMFSHTNGTSRDYLLNLAGVFPSSRTCRLTQIELHWQMF